MIYFLLEELQLKQIKCNGLFLSVVVLVCRIRCQRVFRTQWPGEKNKKVDRYNRSCISLSDAWPQVRRKLVVMLQA